MAAGSCSVWCLYAAIETVPIGTAYAAWTGVGALGTALVGILCFGESTSPFRLLSLLVLTIGLIGAGLSSR
jgi:quaternary ammonium compound-resistance protein SugE